MRYTLLLALLCSFSSLHAQTDTVKWRTVDLSSQGLKATVEVPDNGKDVVLWKQKVSKKVNRVGVTAGAGFILSIDIQAKDVLTDEMYTNISFDAFMKVVRSDADRVNPTVIFREPKIYLVSCQIVSTSSTFYHFERIFSVGKYRYTVTGHNGMVYSLDDCYQQIKAANSIKILE